MKKPLPLNFRKTALTQQQGFVPARKGMVAGAGIACAPTKKFPKIKGA